jgi:fatty acid desaturase
MTVTSNKPVPGIEWPTLLLAGAIYVGWLALTFCWNRLSPWVVLPLGAWLGAWHMSLQHEVIHRHPTRSQKVNDALGFAPIALWLPYFRYKDTHLRHHRDEWLTDPIEDPESTYVSPEVWQAMGPLGRWLHIASMTFIGRLLIGPWRFVLLFWRAELRAAVSGNGAVLRVWAGHLLGVGLVVLWLVAVCHIDLRSYLLLFLWPSYALVLIRSLAEHTKAERWQDRTAVVEHGGYLGLLFLFNNLHILHHARPDLPWYRLPGAWRAQKAQLLSENNGPLYRSYGEVFRHYAWKPRSLDFTS